MSMFEIFAAAFCQARGLSALGMAATPGEAGGRRRQAGSRPARARQFPERISSGAPPRRPIRSRAPSTRTAAAARSGTRSPTRRARSRTAATPTAPTTTTIATRKTWPDEGARRQRLPVFDRLAAGVSGGHGRAEPEGPRFLRPPGRRAARERHRALRDALSLGPAAGAAGPRRRLAVRETVEGVRGLCGLRRRAPERPREALLHAQRSRTFRGLRLRLGHRRARPEAAAGAN